jgi:MHS family proline/betaine transporter-like MFS transporter
MSLSGTRQESRGVSSSRAAVFAFCLGNAVQWYDFALYGAFATIIGPLFFPPADPSTVMLAAFATYGTALIIRPVGALLFGRMADLRGRRAVFVPVILIMAGATAAVRFLPTGISMTAGLATALLGGTAPVVDQILVTTLNLDIAPGLYVALAACLALVALRRWPETAFEPAL